MTLKRSFALLSLSATFLFTTGFVRTVTINLEELPKAQRWAVGEKDEQRKLLKSAKDPLNRAGLSEAVQDWESCVLNAKKITNKSLVKDWAHLLELECSLQLVESDTKTKGAKNPGQLLGEALKHAEGSTSEIHNKVFDDRMQLALLKGRVSLARWLQKRGRWKELRAELQKDFNLETEFSKEDRSALYSTAGELLISERQWGDAFNQLSRARDLSGDSSVIDARIRSILPMLPPNLREQIETKLKASPSATPPPVNPSTEELEIISQSENSLTRNDSVSTVEALSKLLHKFPNGVRAKWAQDKIFELLTQEIERSKGPSGPSVAKKKILSFMGDFDSDRQSEWGKSLFDMQQYADAAPLLKKSADQMAGSTRAEKAYYLAARSFQLTNDNARAKECYQIILKNYAAAPEVIDASIQWALININEGDSSEAITHLEVARSHKLTSQQDLVSLFWLYEGYKQKNTLDRMTETANDLITRFGLTYYGLIAYQDLNKALPQFAKAKTKIGKASFFYDGKSGVRTLPYFARRGFA